MNLALLGAIGATLSWGLGDFFIQRSTRKVGVVESLFIIGIVGCFGLFPFVVADLPKLFEPSLALLLLVLGIITYVFAIVNFKAYKVGKLSVVEVMLEIELPITVILGMLFLGERLTVLQLGLMVLLFVGIILMALQKLTLHIFTGLEKGILLGAISAFGMGFINFLTAVAAQGITPVMAIWVPWFIFTIISAFVLIKNKELKPLLRKCVSAKWDILSMGIYDTLAWTFYALALSQSTVSLTTAVTESYPAIGMFLGIMINKEKIVRHQLLGGVVAVVCSIILATMI